MSTQKFFKIGFGSLIAVATIIIVANTAHADILDPQAVAVLSQAVTKAATNKSATLTTVFGVDVTAHAQSQNIDGTVHIGGTDQVSFGAFNSKNSLLTSSLDLIVNASGTVPDALSGSIESKNLQLRLGYDIRDTAKSLYGRVRAFSLSSNDLTIAMLQPEIQKFKTLALNRWINFGAIVRSEVQNTEKTAQDPALMAELAKLDFIQSITVLPDQILENAPATHYQLVISVDRLNQIAQEFSSTTSSTVLTNNLDLANSTLSAWTTQYDHTVTLDVFVDKATLNLKQITLQPVTITATQGADSVKTVSQVTVSVSSINKKLTVTTPRPSTSLAAFIKLLNKSKVF